MLQGVNIFLISHLTIVHLKCQTGSELALSFVHDTELIRGHGDIPKEYVIPVILIIVKQAKVASMEEWGPISGRLISVLQSQSRSSVFKN